MSYAPAVPLPSASSSSRSTTTNVASNVLPLRSPRATVQIHLTGKTPDLHLATLLHSPLGAYVTQTETLRDSVRVALDIAPEDFDFTLHTLMTTVPEATIRAVTRCIGAKVR
jgi:hypothetical protein